MTMLFVSVASCERATAPGSLPPPPVVASVAPLPQALGQVAPAGALVGFPPTMVILDSDGQGVPGIRVHFAPRAGSGTLGVLSTQSNSQGRAVAANWRLSNALGPQYVDAIVAMPGFVGPYTFTATSVVGPPAVLVASHDTMVIAAGTDSLWTISVRDLAGNPVPIPDGSIALASNNPAVADVDDNGVITAVAGGVARIRATFGSLVADLAVGVDGAAAADEVVDFHTNGDASAMAHLNDDLVLVAARQNQSYRVKLPFPGTTRSTQNLWDIAYAPGESEYYVAMNLPLPGQGELRARAVTGTAERTILTTAKELVSVVVDPEGDRIFVGRDDGRLFSIDRGTEMNVSASFAGSIIGVEPNPATGTVFVASGAHVHELDGATLAVLRSVTVGGFPIRLALVEGGTRLIVVRFLDQTVVLDVSTLSTVATLEESHYGYDVAVHPSGDRFALTADALQAEGGGKIVLYSTGTWELLRTIPRARALRLIYNTSGHVLLVLGGQYLSLIYLQ